MKGNRLWLKWIYCLIPSGIALLIYLLLPHFQSVAEYVFARGIFRIIGFPFQKVVSLLPFSLTEIVVILAIPLILTLFIIWIVKMVKSKRKILTAEKGVRFVAWCLSLVLLVYMVMHGANYYRFPLGDLLKLPENEYTPQDLYNITVDIAKKANAAREKLPEDENGCAIFSVSQ